MDNEKRDEKHVETVVNWLMPTNIRMREEPQAYKASLIRAGAQGMLRYCHDTSVNTAAIDRVETLFNGCVKGMVSEEYAAGYLEALQHLRDELGIDAIKKTE